MWLAWILPQSDQELAVAMPCVFLHSVQADGNMNTSSGFRYYWIIVTQQNGVSCVLEKVALV
jgi:hypothetical protein